MRRPSTLLLLVPTVILGSCVSSPGLAPAVPAATTVVLDFFHTPLPNIPMPNDLATRGDSTSPTGLRVNASLVAPSQLQRTVREKIDQLDGWGAFEPITIPFSGPLDINSILKAHRDPNYKLDDDVVYLINIDRKSPHFGKIHYLDIGNGNYPVVLTQPQAYWKNDPRSNGLSLTFEETEEDLNHNGVLDPGGVVNGVLIPPEDTDADGILDHPNYLPSTAPAATNLAGRADDLMSFYDSQTNTLIARPMEPLDERTTYAVVVTRRLLDANGHPVGSPYPYVNHVAQTAELEALPSVLPAGVSMSDVAFTYAYTTQSEESVFVALRDGLYGHGVQAQLAADYPAELSNLYPVRDESFFPGMKNPYVVYAEQWLPALSTVGAEVLGEPADSNGFQAIADSQQYIDYIVEGSFVAPELFPRYDADGNFLPLDSQTWPPDLTTTPVGQTRPETIYFTLTVPRKENSVRGQGKPAPLALIGHSYLSSRLEGLLLAGYFAKFGYASLSIDAPSHGLPLNTAARDIVVAEMQTYGLGGMGTAMMRDRALDQDNNPDGTEDPGADFWTAYLFHTRDIVRQYALDLMQAIRVMRTFDGKTRWSFDVNGSGSPGLAGDFDGDGVVDVDGNSRFMMVGGSLGGIISMIVGSLDPQISIITPISGGGDFADMAMRSDQDTVLAGVALRELGPLFTGTLDSSGNMVVETIVPNLNQTGDYTIATVSDVKIQPWDTLVAENLTNGARGCGFVNAAGQVRAGVESDQGDLIRLSFYSGPQLLPVPGCLLNGSPTPERVVDTFESQVQFQWDKAGNPNIFAVGSPLVALADGFGLRRSHPDLRNFISLGQLVLDAADPAVYAKHLQKEPLFYPGTGEQTGAHAMISTSIGDPWVISAAGTAFGRAAGLVDYLNDDPRYGVPPNQVLIDNYVIEGECSYGRFFQAGTDDSICNDVENFSQATDMWGSTVPRLSPPLHLDWTATDPLGGVSTPIFPFPQPGGQHAFDLPGQMTDAYLAANGCQVTCNPDSSPQTDPCSCGVKVFDIGYFMMNMLGQYVQSGATKVVDDLCMGQNDCPYLPPVPPKRSGSAIDQ